ncbi:putative sensor domain protein [Beggiatoa alba B18LD]|uniref:Putative sensor domain protein n=1 Tax=Beggiatoa alba B18LD TaxID=395493 RepID=I3CCF1_9GAMM|nr:PocR ligand-binding domain-containing protein [Beggiatoa alba]EIJ41294.1 putative sensor domain protein [Beggiatoa alba B18LD]
MSHLYTIKSISNLQSNPLLKHFSVDKLQVLQDQFATKTGVASLIIHPDGLPITKPSNFSRLCQLIRSTERGNANCMKSDAMIGKSDSHGPIIQPCLSGGLWDSGASIYHQNSHVASWLIGQVFNEAQVQKLDKMMLYGHTIGANMEEFSYAISFATVMSQHKFTCLSNILFVFNKQLSAFISGDGEQSLAENRQQLASLIEQHTTFSPLYEVWEQMHRFYEQSRVLRQIA